MIPIYPRIVRGTGERESIPSEDSAIADGASRTTETRPARDGVERFESSPGHDPYPQHTESRTR